jgi:hypothetical protein
VRIVGYLLLGALAALLLFVGVLGLGDRGIFAGADFFGPIVLLFKFFGPFLVVIGLLGLLLLIPRK